MLAELRGNRVQRNVTRYSGSSYHVSAIISIERDGDTEFTVAIEQWRGGAKLATLANIHLASTMNLGCVSCVGSCGGTGCSRKRRHG